jgi:ribokinase
VAAARAGGAVTFIARLGRDAFGAQARRGLEAAGIDVRFVGSVRASRRGWR